MIESAKINPLSYPSRQQLTPITEPVMLSVTEGITKEHLEEIYSDPYITKIGHDHRPAAPIEHPLVTYLSAWIDGKFAGAFMAIQFTAIELELHALLKKSSIFYSRDLARKFLEWAFEKPILRVTAYIIDGLDSAKNFCLKLGFHYEGRRRNACVQNGSAKDIHVLGMTREDWSAL